MVFFLPWIEKAHDVYNNVMYIPEHNRMLISNLESITDLMRFLQSSGISQDVHLYFRVQNRLDLDFLRI